MAMPVTAHSTNRFLSAFSIRTFTGFSKNRIHNKTTLAPTLTTFIPNGFANSALVRCFTADRLMAKNKLVKRRARCAVYFLFK